MKIAAVFAVLMSCAGVQIFPVLQQFPLIPHIKALKLPSFEKFYQDAVKDAEKKEEHQRDWKYHQDIPGLLR